MDYEEYKKIKESVSNLIESLEKDVTDLETKIASLKKTRRVIYEEFFNQINDKPSWVG